MNGEASGRGVFEFLQEQRDPRRPLNSGRVPGACRLEQFGKRRAHERRSSVAGRARRDGSRTPSTARRRCRSRPRAERPSHSSSASRCRTSRSACQLRRIVIGRRLADGVAQHFGMPARARSRQAAHRCRRSPGDRVRPGDAAKCRASVPPARRELRTDTLTSRESATAPRQARVAPPGRKRSARFALDAAAPRAGHPP